ncbi:MAG: 23S rRNA (guanosine(2251)-2'-O)-methyltransferase RlmB [Desulfonatronovibrionaceae bacterium]
MSKFISGRKPVSEAIAARNSIDLLLLRKGASRPLQEIADQAREAGIACKYVSREELDRQCPGNNQGIAARMTSARITDLEGLISGTQHTAMPLLLALDQLQDPGNVGTLSRTLLALGGAGIILTKNNSAALGAGALKASAGALGRLPLARVTNLARTLDGLKEKGFWIYGAGAGEKGTNAFHFAPAFPAVLVLGNEEKGIRPNVNKRCDTNLHVPMPGGFESINVAQAGAIIIAEFLRQAGAK